MSDFIRAWKIDESLCDKLVEYHKNSPNKVLGMAGDMIDNNTKESIDVQLYRGDDIAEEYINHLRHCINQYVQEFLLDRDSLDILEPFQIQQYNVGGGYKKWHQEQGDVVCRKLHRQLVFMTYLNTVPDGGTEFYHQKIRTDAIKGNTLIWPADWTHTHRGQVSNTSEKYIITGWISLDIKP